ncbi:OmpA family protein [Spirosoma soli]|uniref:OmpA family protein n=1 Tax=Spirosoma soli TaxID=1770529 RepID=A0ABW5M6I2_9BACT
MKLSYFMLLVCSLLCADLSAQDQLSKHYVIYGRCVDTNATSAVKADLFAVINERREPIGTCTKEGRFECSLPASATHLIYEAEGYKSLKIPVHFANAIPSGTRFEIETPDFTLARSTESYAESETLFSFTFQLVDSVEVDLDIRDVRTPGPGLISSVTIFSMRKAQEGFIPSHIPRFFSKKPGGGMRPGQYVLALSTKDKELLSETTFTIRKGYNFVYAPIKKPNNALNQGVHRFPTTTTGQTTLYFDQSKYELRPANRRILDSLIDVLKKQPNGQMTITGYTDNVGRRDLNTTLSEYRAKTIRHYFNQRGISDQQLIIDWKGPDENALPNDPEELKAKSRRVVIQLMATEPMSLTAN